MSFPCPGPLYRNNSSLIRSSADRRRPRCACHGSFDLRYGSRNDRRIHPDQLNTVIHSNSFVERAAHHCALAMERGAAPVKPHVALSPRPAFRCSMYHRLDNARPPVATPPGQPQHAFMFHHKPESGFFTILQRKKHPVYLFSHESDESDYKKKKLRLSSISISEVAAKAVRFSKAASVVCRRNLILRSDCTMGLAWIFTHIKSPNHEPCDALGPEQAGTSRFCAREGHLKNTFDHRAGQT